MAYQDRFSLADQYINHIDTSIANVIDPYIASRYIGFVAVSAVTAYEQAIRDIFVQFSENKHAVFGEFARSHFDRINGRISSSDITRTHLPKFGNKYVKRFQKKRVSKEKQYLTESRVSISQSYNNIISWRNQFAHQGTLPNTATFAEVRNSYERGKQIIHCLAETMVR